MKMTFAEKLLARKAGRPSAVAGEIVEIRPDVALTHDNTAAIYQTFKKIGVSRVFDPGMHAVTLDHAAPAPTTEHAQNHKEVRAFVQEQGIRDFFEVGRGICHQVLVEEGLSLPGEFMVGADSHTPHAGLMGCFAVGVGRTEMAAVWATGQIWIRVPESLRITVNGRLQPGVTAKDLALRVIGELGADGGDYMSVEWHGEGVLGLPLHERAVLPNMMAEMGCKNSYIPPDDTVFKYLEGRARRAYEPVHPDPGARYAVSHDVDAVSVEPMVAKPHTVDNVVPLSEVEGTKIDQAFLGTCTNGRSEDIAIAAEVVRGHRVAVRFIVIPASSEEYLKALRAGHVLALIEAGAIFESPGCGPCMGNHLGVPAPGEVTISSANRNFRGRMGTRESDIYLASPAVVAASAVAGRIVHPREILARAKGA
jgi:3-isopropylmalate/(R)-2-methylmalate dehydratase large subunit